VNDVATEQTVKIAGVVLERNRNDGKVITLDDDVHIIMSERCPNDPVSYDLSYAFCTKDGSVWMRIGTLDEIHKSKSKAL